MYFHLCGVFWPYPYVSARSAAVCSVLPYPKQLHLKRSCVVHKVFLLNIMECWDTAKRCEEYIYIYISSVIPEWVLQKNQTFSSSLFLMQIFLLILIFGNAHLFCSNKSQRAKTLLWSLRSFRAMFHQAFSHLICRLENIFSQKARESEKRKMRRRKSNRVKSSFIYSINLHQPHWKSFFFHN